MLDWSHRKGLITDDERAALDLRFGGERALPVRAVAAQLGLTENALESRLRRATARISSAVRVDRDELERACAQALWPTTPPRSMRGTAVLPRVVA